MIKFFQKVKIQTQNIFLNLKEVHNLQPPLLIKGAIIEHSKHHGKWARSG
jgi:hypothetical protein